MKGFYKLHNGELLHAPNEVFAPEYALMIKDKDKYEYPVDGWRFFETGDEARTAFGLEIEEDYSDIDDIAIIDKKIELLEKRKEELSISANIESIEELKVK